MKRWFIPAATRARGQSNDLNREILALNLFNCHKEVINAPLVPSISRCIHIVYWHKNVWEYQWSNFIYNCMSTFLHYVRCKDALLDCSAPGGERCESLTWVDEICSDAHSENVCSNLFLLKNPMSNFIWPAELSNRILKMFHSKRSITYVYARGRLELCLFAFKTQQIYINVIHKLWERHRMGR